MPFSYYDTNAGFFTANSSGTLTITGDATISPGWGTVGISLEKKGIAPQLYFSYLKKKFGLLAGRSIERRLKTLQRAFDNAVEAGQYALGEKLLLEVARETRESGIYAKGVRKFVEREDVMRHRYKIRDGKISDTRLEQYTRAIPDDVLKKKKAVEDVFDGFVVFHYYNEEQKDVKKMSDEERGKMRDPILFGWIRETDRLYFIADWEDEYCDLTFDELVGVLGKEREGRIEKDAKLDFES